MCIQQIEAAWEQGIGLSICGGEADEYRPWQMILVLLDEDAKPEDPCDEDYMKEISS